MSKEKELSVMAEKIVQDIAVVDDLETMRENLRDLWDNFCIFNDTTDADDRGKVFTTYKALYDALGQIIEYEELRWADVKQEA